MYIYMHIYIYMCLLRHVVVHAAHAVEARAGLGGRLRARHLVYAVCMYVYIYIYIYIYLFIYLFIH